MSREATATYGTSAFSPSEPPLPLLLLLFPLPHPAIPATLRVARGVHTRRQKLQRQERAKQMYIQPLLSKKKKKTDIRKRKSYKKQTQTNSYDSSSVSVFVSLVSSSSSSVPLSSSESSDGRRLDCGAWPVLRACICPAMESTPFSLVGYSF